MKLLVLHIIYLDGRINGSVLIGMKIIRKRINRRRRRAYLPRQYKTSANTTTIATAVLGLHMFQKKKSTSRFITFSNSIF